MEEDEKLIESFISVTSGLRGYFSVLLGTYHNVKYGNYTEPIQTGYASYKTFEEAEVDAKEWAKAELLQYK